MDTLYWTELEVLSRDISAAESRLAAANHSGNYGLARILEQNISDKTKRRTQLIKSITASLVANS